MLGKARHGPIPQCSTRKEDRKERRCHEFEDGTTAMPVYKEHGMKHTHAHTHSYIDIYIIYGCNLSWKVAWKRRLVSSARRIWVFRRSLKRVRMILDRH